MSLMKLIMLFNFVYLSLLNVHNSIRDQILEKIQEKLDIGDYACLNLHDHYIIHLIIINRYEVIIERHDKHKRFTKYECINIQDHLDKNLILKDTIKKAIIRKLYSYKDVGLKYMCIIEKEHLYKNEYYLYNFLKNLSLYTRLIKNYNKSKCEYLKYKSILRNSHLFGYYTYDKRSIDLRLYCTDFDKNSINFALMGKENRVYFFTLEIKSLDLSEYFRFYYLHFKNISEQEIDNLLRFVKNFNFEIHEIGYSFQINNKASVNFINNRRSMNSEKILLTRKMDLKINENQMIWNSICFSSSKRTMIDKNAKFVKISNRQLEEIKNFYAEINKLNLNDLIKRNRLINLLKGSELYKTLLENLLNKKDSGNGLILINTLYSLAIITKAQFKDYLYKQNVSNINIDYIINQISCHYISLRVSLYNLLMYSELENIISTKKDNLLLVRELNEVTSMSSVRKLMIEPIINHLSTLEKLHTFIEKVYYRPDFRTSTIELKHSTGIFLFVCKLLISRLIIDDNLSLSNTMDTFEEDYMSVFYDQYIKSNKK